MSSFDITRKWLSYTGHVQPDQNDATFCKLQVTIDDKNVTEYVDDDTKSVSSHLEIPAYNLAEWIAENWWPLLWEPRKNDEAEGDSEDFLCRHSFLSAQHGFALPSVLILPMGDSVQVSASPRNVPFADVRFRNRAQAICKQELAENVLRGFVDDVVAQLEKHSIQDTCLQEAWTLVRSSGPEELQFCKFAGALGQSPYEIDDKTATLIEKLFDSLGDRMLMDLCSVSTVLELPEVARLAERAVELTKNASESTLSPLEGLTAPKDNPILPAHRRGTSGAKFIRQRFGISETDPRGASKVFDALNVDTRRSGQQNDDEASITGAIVIEDKKMKVALLQPTEIKRNFAAARAIFSGWSAETSTESRLLTAAVTREQQSNRAFAAELTAPLALIRLRASKQFLSKSAIADLSEELQIGADVIAKQAQNNGIQIGR